MLSKTYDSINGHVKHLPGTDNAEETVDALEDGNHHLILILGGGPDNMRVLLFVALDLFLSASL